MSKVIIDVPPGAHIKVSSGSGRRAAAAVAGAFDDSRRRREQRAVSRYRDRFSVGEIVRSNEQGRTILAEVVHLTRPGPNQQVTVRFAHGGTWSELACRWQHTNWRQRRTFRRNQAHRNVS